ncbi:MAG: hypothetical protein WBN02_19395 [Sedimenticolaceae bacterium]
MMQMDTGPTGPDDFWLMRQEKSIQQRPLWRRLEKIWHRLLDQPASVTSRIRTQTQVNEILVEITEYRRTPKIQCVFGPGAIPALAGPRAPVLARPSTHSYGYGFQSSAAPSHTCPQPASGMLVTDAG